MMRLNAARGNFTASRRRKFVREKPLITPYRLKPFANLLLKKLILTLQEIQFMALYGKILLVAMPVFLTLVLFEKWWGWRKGHDTVRNNDMISSLSSGVTNVTKDVLGVGLVIISYDWLLTKVALVHIEATWIVYVIAFLALDFAGYWTHR